MHRIGAEAAEDGERIAQARRWMQERKGHAFLVVAEMVEVVHDCAAQMAEHEPEDGQENFLGCRRHAGRVSRMGMGSRIIPNGNRQGYPAPRKEKNAKRALLNTTRERHSKVFGG